MIKPLLLFFFIIAQVVSCMATNYYLGYGYALVLYIGFVVADYLSGLYYCAMEDEKVKK